MTNSITQNIVIYNGIPCTFINIKGIDYLWDLIRDIPYDQELISKEESK